MFKDKRTKFKENESIVNNSILCISNCLEQERENENSLAKTLAESNIIMDLLYLIGNGTNIEMRKNAGILVAKLAKKDERHLNRMKELDGFSFLKDCKV